MSEVVDTELLVNCTILAFRRFDLNTIVNSSTLNSLNRTEIISLLSGIIENKDNLENINEAKDFLTECLFPSPTRPYELPWEQKTIWAIIFGVMLFVAIAGNCIVLWIVAGHRSMRTVTNYFLLNLSIADLLMSSLNCVFNFIFMLNSDWPFGSIYCTINNFMANVTVSTSVFTLVAISLDRYIAIVHPLKRRTSRRKVRVILLLIWVLSCLLAAPCLMYSSTMTKRYYNGKSRTVCFMLWPDGRYPTSIADYAYNIILLILTYGFPMVVMLICYTLMGRVLWGSRSIGENTDRQMESMRSKRKVVRMFIAIVSIFAICWFPYHMFFIYAYHNNDVTSTKYVQHMYLGFYWLAMSNAMVNPIIYYWMNKRFRLYFQQIMCCNCCTSGKHKIDSADIIANKRSSFQKTAKGDGKNIWKRSTMETQIQVAQTSLRDRITSDKMPKKVIVDCIQEKAKDDLGSPVYISFKDGPNHHRIRIKCISCDEDNKPGNDIQKRDNNETL
ncbi:PREDICTED: tachykinin-like peptides receptor 86C [Rhagoletis zephyria]|uniref:tachykinin-like peptides receptor 86C n=1 Tax=Rhagoletis zephyria TaxID=28612 RepID=UPI0008115743|nr:PREDICTED: tachykinin-like peptides receptor 86C [Rhagoletis zephyria]XP_017462287.1 PREDICTED: tachykinin-like peptides receptor 86C [Rhagoletis zephyria]